VATPTTAPESRTLGGVLALAFLGGLILNFMPCVLPVIALKIFGFVKQSKEEPRRVFRLGLAFVAGVFVFFLGLATAVVVLKAAGGGLNWGFQFQNPYILAGLIGLVFIFGLNLLGVFEITLSSEATTALSSLSSKSGYAGAFLHGLFTTLLGTSCTAPFLSVSLGFAVTQPAPIVFLLFAVVASGMSLPYFLLTSNPKWMKYLPKPGAWMDRFKQLMGFVMIAVVVWLLSVFSQRGSEPATALFWYLFALAVACWIFGIVSNRIVGALVLILAVFGGYFGILYGKLDAPAFTSAQRGIEIEPDGIPWQPFSEGRLDSAVRAGKPVLIDFTAEWCINCKFFERTVLSTDAVKKSIRDHGVTSLKADWTNGDPEITKWLKRFNRVGVPLYVLYRPGEEHPVVLDALTQQIMLSNLAQIKGGEVGK
jgi:thiol:disulfide interchange protein DsbD